MQLRSHRLKVRCENYGTESKSSGKRFMEKRRYLIGSFDWPGQLDNWPMYLQQIPDARHTFSFERLPFHNNTLGR